MQNDETRFARECVSKEFDYRREQVWRIFTWGNGILLAIAGLFIALSGQRTITLEIRERIMFNIFAFIITVFSIIWILTQTHFARNVEAVLEHYDNELSVMHQLPNAIKPKMGDRTGYVLTLFLMLVAVSVTIWFLP